MCLRNNMEPSEWQSEWKVQDPCQRGPFMKEHLVWTPTVKSRVFQRGSPNLMPVCTRYALIPWARVADFIAGEEGRKGFPTSFVRLGSRKITENRVYRTDFEYSEYTEYWCPFGKDDYRSPRIAAEGQQSQGKRRSKICSGQSIKHGCLCHFEVKRLFARPEVAVVFFEHTEHVDAAGLICHGASYLGDPRARLAPHLSSDIRIWVKKKLLSGMSRHEVLAEHLQNVKQKALQPGYVEVRDDLLQMKDIQNIDKATILIPASPPPAEAPTPEIAPSPAEIAPSPERNASHSTDATDVAGPSDNDEPGQVHEVESMETMEYFTSLLVTIQRLVQADPKLLEYACPISRDMLNRLKEIQSKIVSWDFTLVGTLHTDGTFHKDCRDTSTRKRPFVGS